MAAAPATDEARPVPEAQGRALRVADRVGARAVPPAVARSGDRGPRGTAPATTRLTTARAVRGAELRRVTIGRPGRVAGGRVGLSAEIALSDRTDVRRPQECSAPLVPATLRVSGRSEHRAHAPKVVVPPVIVRRVRGRTAVRRVIVRRVVAPPVIVRRVLGRTAVPRVTVPRVLGRTAVPRVTVPRVTVPRVVAPRVIVRRGRTASRRAIARRTPGRTADLRPEVARRRRVAPDVPRTIARTDAHRCPRARRSPSGWTHAVLTRRSVAPCGGLTLATPSVSPPIW
jgi:hypothetical protein